MSTRRHPVRVLSLPAGHAYVRSVLAGASGVELLPDPPVPGAPAGQWWPSPAWDPQWVRAHRTEVDLVHVHFGFEHLAPAQVADWTDTLRRVGLPLVVTVHDLDLPHAVEQDDHRARVRLLVEAADAVLTLTPGAADRIERATGRRAVVVPHPAMEPREHIEEAVRAPRPEGPVLVGVHLKSLRANAGRTRLLDGLLAATDALGPAACRLEVTLHRELLRPGVAGDVAAWVRDAPERVDVRAVDPLDDAAFSTYLQHLDVSVLPHRWGTHSGWVEQCHDLGVVPLAPSVGHLAEQRVEHLWAWEGERPEPASLRTALEGAVTAARAGRSAEQARAWADHRARETEAVGRAHVAVYEQVVDEQAARDRAAREAS
ncbi:MULTISPECIES: glycosyltransferase [Kytococcus]|uniref:Glycosyltransferase subfamily 4-like N-terminal domain-containing protein n=1 Tax=Kytococcus schroeteri TaxID=138300 RepID=A0A2I1PCX0_9MICO|nr:MULTISPECIES: glycosyltransferase [Kytococcus]OFS15466.1 hypothetical protein HMPREF3099_01980 [Kytococcus sp. HMSC28H12]PKZ42466.1 hypothetical protein CYJ76_02635 [Kytococcus schroeteri]